MNLYFLNENGVIMLT